MAAIAMEEVLPSSVADAEARAPEEMYAKKRGREAEFLEGEAMRGHFLLVANLLTHPPFSCSGAFVLLCLGCGVETFVFSLFRRPAVSYIYSYIVGPVL